VSASFPTPVWYPVLPVSPPHSPQPRDGPLSFLPLLWSVCDASLLHPGTHADRNTRRGDSDQGADPFTKSAFRYWHRWTHRRLCGRNCHFGDGNFSFQADRARSRCIRTATGVTGHL